MAVLEIVGLLNGRRLRKCSDAARWAFAYYYLLANGYGRIELDYEAISEHFISFRGTAPSPEDVQQHFEDYRSNHLMFVYTVGRKTWGQWDTERSRMPRHKTAIDRKSPAPPEGEYQEWLKEQHPEDWGKYHWHHAPKDVSQNQSLPKSSENLLELPKPAEDFCCGVGVGGGVGKTNPLTPFGPAAADSDSKPEDHDIDPWQAGQATAELLGLGGQQKVLARDACAAVKRRKPNLRYTEIPDFIQKLWREYDSLAIHAKVSLKTFLGEIGRFIDSDSWRAPARASPAVDDHGGHFEGTVYVTKDGKRMPGYKPPPKVKGTTA